MLAMSLRSSGSRLAAGSRPAARRFSGQAATGLASFGIGPGVICGAVAGAYFGLVGMRVVQARNGTLPENLDGPLAALTASKAIKKWCTPDATVEVAPASQAAEPDLDPEPEYIPMSGEPEAGSPQHEKLLAGLTKISLQLQGIVTECEVGRA